MNNQEDIINKIHDLMSTMDECFGQIESAYKELNYEKVLDFTGLVAEGFLTINNALMNDFKEQITPYEEQINQNIVELNHSFKLIMEAFTQVDKNKMLDPSKQLKHDYEKWEVNVQKALEFVK